MHSVAELSWACCGRRPATFCSGIFRRCRWSASSTGSLATTIIGLLSLEIASIILLLEAQVIAEYERLEDGDTAPPGELKTEATRAEVK